MDLDATLALILPLQRPLECLKAKLDGRRVKGVYVASKLEYVVGPAGPRLGDDLVGELLEDAVIAPAVGFGQIAFRGRLAKPKMERFPGMGLGRENNIP